MAAVIHAWASARPLLIRGEAGCGKSQLARAVAAALDVPLITEVIHPRFEATDLLYREDPVKRLAHAQLLAAAGIAQGTKGDAALKWLTDELAPARFVTPGPLWLAMKQEPASQSAKQWPRAVVLIDEIDKADADIPNALLDVLGNRSFRVPSTDQVISAGREHAPLIFITTNEDRELPHAFVRRCAVLNLQPPDADEATFTAWLRSRAAAHKALAALAGDDASPMAVAAIQVWQDREQARKQTLPTVGLAEYLDLLYSLQELSQGQPAAALALLNDISAYALVKHREQDQGRQGIQKAG